MNTIIKNTVRVAAIAAGAWAVKKFELDKKVKDKWEKAKYAQVQANLNDKNFDCFDNDSGFDDSEDDKIEE